MAWPNDPTNANNETPAIVTTEGANPNLMSLYHWAEKVRAEAQHIRDKALHWHNNKPPGNLTLAVQRLTDARDQMKSIYYDTLPPLRAEVDNPGGGGI